MGGSALKNTKTVRADDSLYLDAYRHVVSKVSREYSDLVHYLPRTVRSKSEHGDLDLLVRGDTVSIDRDTINQLFSPNELVVNDSVWSFDVFQFQTDLITKQKKYWQFSKSYYSFGGLGNLMSKLARWHRYKLGFQGFRMPVYRDPQGEKSVKYGEYTLTRNPQKAFEFLGFDYERFQEGFTYMSDVFEYVRQSEHFCKKAFEPKNMTADQRHRDRKRPVWDRFKTFLKNIDTEETPTRPTQEEAIQKAKETFPESEIHDRLERDKETIRLREKARKTWTGEVPMNEFGIEGKKLGEMIESFRNTFNSKLHRFEWIVRNSREEAIERFKWANSDYFGEEVNQKLVQGDEY